jgi:hypothetical protein
MTLRDYRGELQESSPPDGRWNQTVADASGEKRTEGGRMRRKGLRPTIETMEPRIALSSSNGFSSFFTNLIDSITGKSSTSSKSSATPHVSAAKAAQLKEMRHERLVKWDAAHPHAKPRA